MRIRCVSEAVLSTFSNPHIPMFGEAAHLFRPFIVVGYARTFALYFKQPKQRTHEKHDFKNSLEAG
jgi:hypothetical protein